MLTLLKNRSRSSQGHDLYTHCILSHKCQVSLKSVNQFRRRCLKDFTIYGHGGHLGHVNWIIYIYIDFPFLWILLIKFGFDWPSGFREEDV